MNWTWKDLATIASVGVVTTIAIEFAMKFLRDQAILSARAEMERVLLAAQEQQRAAAQLDSTIAPSAPPAPEGLPLLSDGDQGYTNIR